MEKIRLNCLVIKIIEHKKEATTHRIQLEQSLAKKVEVVETLTLIIEQSYVNNIIVIAIKKN